MLYNQNILESIKWIKINLFKINLCQGKIKQTRKMLTFSPRVHIKNTNIIIFSYNLCILPFKHY
jgi:hypothetical protein